MEYLWLKAFHVISIITWMAGLLYLPRLFVVHRGAAPGGPLSLAMVDLERRVYRFIVNPAMMASWTFGLWMIFINPGLLREGWLHAKITLVVAMTVLHLVFGYWVKDFAREGRPGAARIYRSLTDLPAALMILIVILVVLRPF